MVIGGAEGSLMGWVNPLKCVFYSILPSLFHLTRVLFFFFFPLIPDMMHLGEGLGMIAQIILGHVTEMEVVRMDMVSLFPVP